MTWSTYMQMFFNNMYYRTTRSLLFEYAAADHRYRWLKLKLYVNFQLCGGLAFLTNTLLKGQQ